MMNWLERIPMYRLVVMLLGATALVAIVLSIAGQLSYEPLPLVASLLVAVLIAVGSGWLAARAVGLRLHLESSLITGLLVFFIMQPSIDALGLGGVALASLVASASKYVLAFRRRHVFNPAATGALIVGIAGLAYPAWWVGTAALQPIVIIAAALVLYRTKRLIMGVVFIATATVITLLSYTLAGQSVETALSFVFLSSPLIFLAGFMLSEPLTLPPRRWQQFAVALLVAVIATVPFNAGVFNKYLLALLVGNLVAFLFGQRRGIRLAYLGKKQLSPTSWELAFQPARPVRFLPGQYMELTLPHRKIDFRGSRRYFSISSAPTTDGPITFAITVPEKSSSFKRALLDLEPGALVHGTGVGGDFRLPRSPETPVLLVAGGIGITPFASQLAHLNDNGEKRDVVVAYATSTPGPLPYASLLEESGARVVLFGPEPDTLPVGWQYAGEGRITGERLAGVIPDIPRRRAFVSGPPALVNDLRRALRSQGARRVHTDYFSGY